MKWIFICGLLLLAMCCSGCTADRMGGKFEADLTVDPATHQITGLHVSTTKNYGNIHASGTIDPKTNMPLFSISAENVDATTLAAIVAKSNADIAKSVAGVAGGVIGSAAGAVMGVPLQ